MELPLNLTSRNSQTLTVQGKATIRYYKLQSNLQIVMLYN